MELSLKKTYDFSIEQIDIFTFFKDSYSPLEEITIYLGNIPRSKLTSIKMNGEEVTSVNIGDKVIAMPTPWLLPLEQVALEFIIDDEIVKTAFQISDYVLPDNPIQEINSQVSLMFQEIDSVTESMYGNQEMIDMGLEIKEVLTNFASSLDDPGMSEDDKKFIAYSFKLLKDKGSVVRTSFLDSFKLNGNWLIDSAYASLLESDVRNSNRECFNSIKNNQIGKIIIDVALFTSSLAAFKGLTLNQQLTYATVSFLVSITSIFYYSSFYFDTVNECFKNSYFNLTKGNGELIINSPNEVRNGIPYLLSGLNYSYQASIPISKYFHPDIDSGSDYYKSLSFAADAWGYFATVFVPNTIENATFLLNLINSAKAAEPNNVTYTLLEAAFLKFLEQTTLQNLNNLVAGKSITPGAGESPIQMRIDRGQISAKTSKSITVSNAGAFLSGKLTNSSINSSDLTRVSWIDFKDSDKYSYIGRSQKTLSFDSSEVGVEQGCPDAIPVKHPNGGGIISLSSSVSPDAYVSSDSRVCGQSTIGRGVAIQSNSFIESSLISGCVTEINSKSVIRGSTITNGVSVSSASITNSRITGAQSHFGCKTSLDNIHISEASISNNAIVEYDPTLPVALLATIPLVRMMGDVFINGSEIINPHFYTKIFRENIRITGGRNQSNFIARVNFNQSGNSVIENSLISTNDFLVTDDNPQIGELGFNNRYSALTNGIPFLYIEGDALVKNSQISPHNYFNIANIVKGKAQILDSLITGRFTIENLCQVSNTSRIYGNFERPFRCSNSSISSSNLALTEINDTFGSINVSNASFINYTKLGSNASISGSYIDNSVIGDRSLISNATIDRSSVVPDRSISRRAQIISISGFNENKNGQYICNPKNYKKPATIEIDGLELTNACYVEFGSYY